MSKRILVVDDEFGLADLVASLLRESGYEVALAINGRLGLARLADQTPDLVLLDVMMPVLDGVGMLRAMRARPEWAAIPVVMMTSAPSSVPNEQPPLHQGLLRKPFDPDALFAAVHKQIGPGHGA